MSSSSATACSRSPSPTTPATPESIDNIDPIVTQEDLNAWCQSLSPSGYYVGDDSHYSLQSKQGHVRDLELDDILQDDVVADPTSDVPSNALSSPSPPTALPISCQLSELMVPTPSPITSTKPVPPPVSHIRRDQVPSPQNVVYPPKEACHNLPIMIPSIPEGGTKSRVETQVRLTVDLAHASASSGEPLRYDRVGSWKWLRLPKGTSTKRRARKDGKIDAPPEDTLYLSTEVTCASPPHTRVTCCTSCQGREAKRVARKLAARVRPARSDSESPDDAVIIPGRGKHEDTSNLVQFNCPEVLDFSTGSVILPLRITCYCRHHREKVGFHVHFTMLDHNGRVVGSGTTRPIMITDDHKSTGVNKAAKEAAANATAAETDYPNGLYDEATGGKRKPIRAETIKKRTAKPYDNAKRSKFRRDASDGDLQSIPSAVTSTTGTRESTPAGGSQCQSPLRTVTPQQLTSAGVDAASAEVAASLLNNAFDLTGSPVQNAPPTQTYDDTLMGNAQMDMQTHSMSLDQLANSVFLPGPTGNMDNSLAMPVDLDSSQQFSVSPNVSQMLFHHSPPPVPTFPPPKIHRLIPNSGPTHGGIEVTVLGANFHPAMQLNCVFGGTVSTSTQRWSDNTLVCLLPPSNVPGVVPVWFDGVPKEEDGSPPVMFTYTDDTDRALMELALQVVGLKMTGKIEDARNVAMRIVSTTGPNDNAGDMNSNHAMQLSSSTPGSSLDIRQLLLARADDSGQFEKMILDFLALLDVPMDLKTSSLVSTISHATPSGQTLLHLACILGFSTVVRFLLSHEIDVDARDKNGYTALHFAGASRASECAKALLERGAATDVVNADGKTAAEIAPVGFFDRLDGDSSSMDRSLDEEAEWADEEGSSEDDTPKLPPRRRLERGNSYRKEKPSRRPSQVDLKHHDVMSSMPSEKKAVEAGLVVDEKQAMATWMNMVQRTFAQLQHPQGIQGMIPNIPLPHLPHLPGMPAWGAFPQMPAVFPVNAPPIPASWAQLWRQGQQAPGAVDGEKPQQLPWLGIPTAQEWRAMWEKWMTNAAGRPGGADDREDSPPPAYTPREEGSATSPEKVPIPISEETPVEIATSATTPTASAKPSSSALTRRAGVGYEDVPIPEQELNAYGYRPAKKQSRKAHKKHDPMLFFFWIPILLIGFIWALLHAMRVAFHAYRTVGMNTALHVQV